MKLDGEFATLLTNMMVLEAMAKDIDPEINILKCAIPYFSFIQDQSFVEAVAEKSTHWLCFLYNFHLLNQSLSNV